MCKDRVEGIAELQIKSHRRSVTGVELAKVLCLYLPAEAASRFAVAVVWHSSAEATQTITVHTSSGFGLRRWQIF